MAHQRQIIREAAAEQLRGKTGAETRVFESRVTPFKRLELPAIAVYSLEESIDPDSRLTSPRVLTRDVKIAVDAAVKLLEDVDDAIDTLSAEIEAAVQADPTFSGAANDAVLESTTIDLVPDGEKPMGVLRLVYAVRYFTDTADVQAALDDLKTVDVKTSLGGIQAPADQAEDKLENLDT